MTDSLIKKLKFKKYKSTYTISFGSRIYEGGLKPGHVLKMKDGVILLVGDVNKHLGVCDDCTNYDLKDIKEIALLPEFTDE